MNERLPLEKGSDKVIELCGWANGGKMVSQCHWHLLLPSSLSLEGSTARPGQAGRQLHVPGGQLWGIGPCCTFTEESRTQVWPLLGWQGPEELKLRGQARTRTRGPEWCSPQRQHRVSLWVCPGRGCWLCWGPGLRLAATNKQGTAL